MLLEARLQELQVIQVLFGLLLSDLNLEKFLIGKLHSHVLLDESVPIFIQVSDSQSHLHGFEGHADILAIDPDSIVTDLSQPAGHFFVKQGLQMRSKVIFRRLATLIEEGPPAYLFEI